MDLLRNCRYSVASYGPGAAYAAWLLRSFGASVRHVSALDPEGLGAFLAEGGESDDAPPLRPTPGETFITDAPVTAANRRVLESAALAGRVIWITPWGLDSSWAERPASDLTLYAASGWMYSVGDPGRPPLAPPGAQCRFIAGQFATIAAVEHAAKGAAPSPGLVDVPVIEALVATLIYDPVAFQYFGRPRGRAGNRLNANQPLIATLACQDGFIGLHTALHRQWVALAELIGHPEIVKDARFETIAARSGNIPALDEGYLLPWLASRTRWQAYHELQRHRIPASGHPDMAEVLSSPQLEARKSWHTVTTPGGRSFQVPGEPARIPAEAGPGQRDNATGPWRAGALRVVDLSMGWAGPFVGMNLAAMGADVIKVESHTHFDWWRGSRPPGDGDGGDLHERSHVFNSVNRGKRGITLDLTHPRGREIALDLIASADVVIENFAAGVIEKLGLTYAAVSVRNPSLIMLRQPGFGSDGPESGYVVFGNTIEGMSGLSSLIGYEGGPPTMLSNACGDPVSGLGGTLAVLAALEARSHDGKGRVIECAQLEGFLPMVSEALIAYQQTGQQPRRQADRRPGHTPSGAFPLGDDRWLALEVETDEQWAALAKEIDGAWAHDPSLLPSSGREARRDAIEAATAAWVAATGEAATLSACDRAHVPASLVMSEGETLGLEPLLVSGFWQGIDREPVGYHLYPGIAFSSAGLRPLPGTAAPLLGEHTAEVLAAMGYDADARDGLAAAGVTGRVPVRA